MVIVRAKQLCCCVLTVTDKSPKKFRFTLVARQQGYALGVVENLFKANLVRVRGRENIARIEERGELQCRAYVCLQTFLIPRVHRPRAGVHPGKAVRADLCTGRRGHSPARGVDQGRLQTIREAGLEVWWLRSPGNNQNNAVNVNNDGNVDRNGNKMSDNKLGQLIQRFEVTPGKGMPWATKRAHGLP